MKKSSKKIKKPAAVLEAREENRFWINYGPAVKNLTELKQALVEMDNEKFDYHTKLNGNHFASWIEDILGDAKLAKKLRRLKSRQGFINTIDKYLG